MYCKSTALISLLACNVISAQKIDAEKSDIGVHQKILIYKNIDSTHIDTIQEGSFVKLRVLKPSKKQNDPHSKKKIKSYESMVVNVTDSSLILLKKPVLPFVKNIIPFDSIGFSTIIGYKVFNKKVETSISNTAVMPIMSVLPSSVMAFPYMFFIMPLTQYTGKLTSGIVNPINWVYLNDSLKYTHRLGNIKVLDDFVAYKKNMTKDDRYEWESERVNRWEKIYHRAENILDQQIILNNVGQNVINVTFSNMFYPNSVKGPADTKSRVNIPDNTFSFGIVSEKYISNSSRLGFEMMINIPPKSQANTINGTFSFSAGFVNSISSFAKIGIGRMYSQKKREYLVNRLIDLSRDTSSLQNFQEFNHLKNKLNLEPKFYWLFGLGVTNTTLFRVRGSMASETFASSDYKQKKILLQSGFGTTIRLTTRFQCDLSAKYLWSPNYNPSIGGLKSNSGIKVQLSFGYLSGPGFALKKKILNKIKSDM